MSEGIAKYVSTHVNNCCYSVMETSKERQIRICNFLPVRECSEITELKGSGDRRDFRGYFLIII